MHKILLAFAALLAIPAAHAQIDWEAPFPPHHIIDNIYFVGTEALGTYLITTDEGHILINSDFETTVPILKANVEQLGFRFEDIEVILGSHAHGDHMEGDALAKQLSGAQVMAMAEDVPLLQTLRPGGREHPVDRILRDGDIVTLGNTTLTAHLTPGHTPGCTTWTLQVVDNAQPLDVVIVCSYGANEEYQLVDNPDYPQIAADYRATYAKARSLPIDVFLGSHGFFHDLAGKYQKLQTRAAGDQHPYIDPDAYHAYINGMEAAFEAMLKEQQAAQ